VLGDEPLTQPAQLSLALVGREPRLGTCSIQASGKIMTTTMVSRSSLVSTFSRKLGASTGAGSALANRP
jgi:hypothetical protein